jgi:hypothetical protein
MLPKRKSSVNKKRNSQWLSATEGEKYLDLYREVLIVATRDLKKTHVYSNRSYASLGNRTRKWFYAKNNDGTFSFLNCCRVLGYSPQKILRELSPYKNPIIPKKKLLPAREKQIQKSILARFARFEFLTITDLTRSRIPKRITGAEPWEIRNAMERLVKDGYVRKNNCEGPEMNKKFSRYSLSKKGKRYAEKICQESDI